MTLMKLKKGIENFKVGDIIPIRVGQSMYKIGNAHILVNGYPFLPYVPERVYYSIGEVSNGDKEHFKNMVLPLIEIQLKRKEDLNPSRWNEFSKLLHPYKIEPIKAKSDVIDLLNIESIQHGLFGIDYNYNLSNLQVSKTKPNASENITIVSESPKLSLTCIGFTFVKWLEAINDLTEQYNSDDEYENQRHIWELYTEHKL